LRSFLAISVQLDIVFVKSMRASIRGVVLFETGKSVSVVSLAVDSNARVENANAALTKAQVVIVTANLYARATGFGHDETSLNPLFR
jgi:hypothetical protein